MDDGRSHPTWHARAGRLSAAKRRALDELLPRRCLSRWTAALAEGGRPVVVEIGAGTGEAALALALARPELTVVACEVHRASLATLLLRAEAEPAPDLVVHHGDGRSVLADVVAPGSLAGIRAYFPDPWPKRRHHHRRLVTPGFAALAADRLRPGATLEVATDDAHYGRAIRRVLEGEPRLVEAGRSPFGPRPPTHYAARAAAEGRTVIDFVWARSGTEPAR